MTAPRVSLVLPTFNGERYLSEAVDSCLAQTFEDFELIVVVDGSTDGSEALLRRYRDPRVVVHVTANQGLPRALNTGFQRARGAYLGWTSDDNLYLPDALRVMVAHLDAQPRSPMVCTDCLVIDGDGRTQRYSDDMWACFLYRATAAAQAGPYRPEFRLVEDVDFFLRLQHFAGPIARISEPHYKYRVHGESLSAKQLRDRHLVSLKLHYDLVSRGIERLDLRELFFDRLSKAAMHRDADGLDEMVAFARTQGVPFLSDLERQKRFLSTPWGWLYNRSRIAAMTRLRAAYDRVRRRVAR